ncbi:MAG: RHS repeat-associated core domain-containing protein, partial [Rhodanobacteraceae bacterium]
NRTDRTDPTTVQTHTVYDPLNRLKTTLQDYQGSDPSTANATTDYAYDTRDNLRQVTDPNALTTSYTFDGLDNLDSLASPDTGNTTYLQDAAGNRTSQTDARSVTTTYQYDALNRLTRMDYSAQVGLPITVRYYYDESNATTACAISYPVGRLTTMTDATGSTTYCYDHRGNVIGKTQVQKGGTYVVGYAYDLADRLSAIDYPDGARVEYTRDALGRITQVKVRPTGTGTLTSVVSNITWQPFGPALTYTFATGSQSLALAYDQNYWLTDVAGSVLNLHLCRDSVADITRTKASTPACTGTPIEQYTYDNLYRLTEVDDGSGGLVESYAYNLTGDRLSKTQGGATTPYGYGNPFTSHHLLTVGTDSRDYDAAGNPIDGSKPQRQYTFDARNRLVAYSSSGPSGGSGSYNYNGRGERVFKDAAYGIPNHQDSAHYVYDETGMLLTDNGNGNVYPTDYVYANGRPIALVRNGTIYYVHSDQLGTPRAVTAAGSATPVWTWSFTGNPFGEQQPTGTFRMNLRFPGQYFDQESGLAYNYYRDYEAGTGRYVESDPIGLSGGAETYAYVDSTPLLDADLSGLLVRGLGCTDKQWGRVQHAEDNVRKKLKECRGQCDLSASGKSCVPCSRVPFILARLTSTPVNCDKRNPNCGVSRAGSQSTASTPDRFDIGGPGFKIKTCGCLENTILHEMLHIAGIYHPGDPADQSDPVNSTANKCFPCGMPGAGR